jgi:hypothetical protein
MSDVSYPPVDVAALMPRSEAETAIADLTKGRLVQVYSGNVSETTLVSLALGVRRFSISVPASPGVTTSDRIVIVSGGAPSAGCELFSGYVSGVNTVNIGLLVPALGIGATYSVPVIIYKITS